ncbi:S41 family peptidase [Henriciella sp. AS95]|uniref:S41 family peptidase n=1 Tax=Henriciella sp. AS95 TaxID=3135782 RepID=UPI00316DB1DA
MSRFWTVSGLCLIALNAPFSAAYSYALEEPVDSEETREVKADVLAFCELVRSRYAYFESRAEIWAQTCSLALEEAETPAAQTTSGHLAVLERMVDQLYDNHVSLNINSSTSPRLVPSGSDYWMSMESGVPVVLAVRPGSGAAAAGLRVGDVVRQINGQPPLAAASERIRAATNVVSATRLTWALNAQGAGYRGAERRLVVQRGRELIDLDLGDPEPDAAEALVTARLLPGKIGYLRIEDALGNEDTVEAFDAALDTLKGAKRWIIDLRNTPGGGNTATAEPILGRFIGGVKPYQRSGPRWRGERTRYVASRGPWRVRGKVAVLVGRWTGSMGEGMAIGFDGLKRGRVFGTSMAGLAGGVEGFELPGSGWSVRFPTYDLLHIRGESRHHWRPPYPVIADNGDGADLALQAAMNWLD